VDSDYVVCISYWNSGHVFSYAVSGGDYCTLYKYIFLSQENIYVHTDICVWKICLQSRKQFAQAPSQSSDVASVQYKWAMESAPRRGTYASDLRKVSLTTIANALLYLISFAP
jgi:hypothetical protein